jgi:hypothetical protein
VLRCFKISIKFVISCHLFFMVISGIACLTTTLGSFIADNKCSFNGFFKVGIITVRYIIMVIYVSMAGHHIPLVKPLAFLILFVNPHFLFILLQIHLQNLPCLKILKFCVKMNWIMSLLPRAPSHMLLCMYYHLILTTRLISRHVSVNLYLGMPACS